jgi:hypothetical protein
LFTSQNQYYVAAESLGLEMGRWRRLWEGVEGDELL